MYAGCTHRDVSSVNEDAEIILFAYVTHEDIYNCDYSYYFYYVCTTTCYYGVCLYYIILFSDNFKIDAVEVLKRS